MSRNLIEKARQRLATERGASPASRTGSFRVALVYPNTYHHAMSNLGFQTVYHLLNSRDGCSCERFCLPDTDDLAEHQRTGFPLFSLESQTPLCEFDLIALSVSFENDFVHIPILMQLGHLSCFSDQRTENDPLVLMGGVCAFLNPEPVADLVDMVAVGEAEPILPPLLDLLMGYDGPRTELRNRLAQLPGIYVPSLYSIDYADGGQVAAIAPRGQAPARVARCYLADLDDSPSRSFIHTSETEFRDMSLVEISRGCSRGCRFCAAGYIYLPERSRSIETLRPQIETGLCEQDRIGLVAAAVADHPAFSTIQAEVLEKGGTISVSSLRLDALTADDVLALQQSGHRTVSLAPEAGSQRLRDFINKGLTEEQILAAVHLLADGSIRHLKLYFLIGLPTEGQDDIDELLTLVEKIRLIWRAAGQARGALGTVTLSLNPFIPKPFTPLQWAGMEAEKVLKKRLQGMRSAIARMPNTQLHCESIRGARLQALLARGDRRVAQLLPLLAEGLNLKQACRRVGIDPAFYIERVRSADERFPWEVIAPGVSRDYLWCEYQRAVSGQLTPRCSEQCQQCGVC
ncbi:MAG: radical SAM protein [Desulfuromonas sp.]|nr:MAG: radical SAM protein [Desulfuromonas sp.]